jgi:hypothetical protein
LLQKNQPLALTPMGGVNEKGNVCENGDLQKMDENVECQKLPKCVIKKRGDFHGTFGYSFQNGLGQ